MPRLQPHRKRKGIRPDVTLGTQTRKRGETFVEDKPIKEEGTIKKGETKAGGEPIPETDFSKKAAVFGGKERFMGHALPEGTKKVEGYPLPLGGFPTEVVGGIGTGVPLGVNYGKDLGQSSKIAIDIIKNHPKAAAWAATIGIATGVTISGKASLMSWTAVDNIGQRASFLSGNAINLWRRGEISTEDATEAIEVELRDVEYAESFVKKEVVYNPASWFGLGKPSLLAAEANTRTIKDYLETLKGGV